MMMTNMKTPNWAIECLRTSTLKDEILKALDYFEYNDHVGFLEEIERFEVFDPRPGGIGKLVDKYQDRFPYLCSAFNAWTAGSCYYTEPHPSGEIDSMNYYIAHSQYRSSSLIHHYIVQRGNKLSFYDENEYYGNYYQGKMERYEPFSNHPVGKVLEVLASYDIPLKAIYFYGLEINKFPSSLLENYSDTKIILVNCLFEPADSSLVEQLSIEEKTEKLN